jgi:hypothetical protein
MKKILSVLCIGSFALAATAWGLESNQGNAAVNKKGARRAAAVQSVAPQHNNRVMSNAGRVNTQRNFSTARVRQRNFNATSQINSNAVVRQNHVRNRVNVARENHAITSSANLNSQNAARFNRRANINRTNTVAINRERNINRANNVVVNRERNINRVNNFNRERNVTVVNNWRGDRFRGQNYAAFRNYRREWHDRGWWTSHHPRITFYFGAPYYWDTGYWYPAWGYYPGYQYPYDGPIYGGSYIAPDQLVLNVQEQLARDGYYNGPIDGLLGPQTRHAIAAFQVDHGLAPTAAVDEPTLETLGLA